MILEEVEHASLQAVDRLPCAGDGRGRGAAFDHGAQRVVEAHLVVEVVEAAVVEVAAVDGWVVDFGYEDDALVALLDAADGPLPEVDRHHVRHVAAEAVDAASSPVEQDVEHLLPRRGHGVEVVAAAALIVDAVVQLHRLVPVVLARRGREAVVARHLGRIFHVVATVEVGRELLSGDVVEVVLRRECLGRVVVLSEVAYSTWRRGRLVAACHVVGHEVDYHPEPRLVGAFHQGVELLHAPCRVVGQVARHAVVVRYGVGRAGHALQDVRILAHHAVGRPVGGRRLLQQASIPYIVAPQVAYAAQGGGREVAHLAAAVLGQRAARAACRVHVAVQAHQRLVDDDFLFCGFGGRHSV